MIRMTTGLLSLEFNNYNNIFMLDQGKLNLNSTPRQVIWAANCLQHLDKISGTELVSITTRVKNKITYYQTSINVPQVGF